MAWTIIGLAWVAVLAAVIWVRDIVGIVAVGAAPIVGAVIGGIAVLPLEFSADRSATFGAIVGLGLIVAVPVGLVRLVMMAVRRRREANPERF